MTSELRNYLKQTGSFSTKELESHDTFMQFVGFMNVRLGPLSPKDSAQSNLSDKNALRLF